jgi:hypothetical protein
VFRLHLELKWHVQAVRHRELAQALVVQVVDEPRLPAAEWAGLDEDPSRRRRFVVTDARSEMQEP